MINYFDYYGLNYENLKNNALKHDFVNDITKNEYFLGLERAKKKEYNVVPFSELENPYEPGSIDWIKEEIKNCKSDINHFCQYVKIKHVTESYIPYKPYLFQQKYYNTLLDNKYTITDKCRQVGMSVATTVYILWLCLFKYDQTVDIISISDRESKSFLSKLKGTYENLPKWFKAVPYFQKDTDNEHSIKWRNGSFVQSLPRTKEGSRSGSLSLLVFDEAAFIEYMESQWAGSYYTVARSVKSKALVISTRNGTVGTGQWYYEKLTSTQNGETDFSLVETDWWEVPEYLQEPSWLDGAFKNTSRDTFLQEVCKKWLVAGDTVLDKETLINYPIKEHIHNHIINHEGFKERIEGLNIWAEPEEEVNYVITSDVGTGSAKNFSAFHIWDTRTHVQIGEYKARISTNNFAKILEKVGKYYNEAVLVVERNNPGEAVISDLYNVIKYPNLFRRKRKKVAFRDYGWVTSPKTRPLLINALIDDYENNNIKINGKRTIDELLGFIWDEKSGKPKAAPGNNDDLVLSLSMYCFLKDSLEEYYKAHQLEITHENNMEEQAKLWGICEEGTVKEFYEENYWVYGAKTQDKIRKNILEKLDKNKGN